MNEVINAMATDMNITPYIGEAEVSFVFRVVYSALGRWCLESARVEDGISKHGQTTLLNNLIEKYIILFPEIKEMIVQEDKVPISVFIRRVYEETGFLITDSANHNKLANYQRGLHIGTKQLLYGVSGKTSNEGLGVFSDDIHYTVPWREALIRDSLGYEDYLSAAFDVAIFSPRDIEKESLRYFNPRANVAPSSSWISSMITDKTVARNLANGAYYRVMQYGDEVLYYDDVPNTDTDGLTGFEYRRLYYALKKHYGLPLKAQIQSLDDQYSKVSLGGHLPNREYYLILLYSWPYQMYCNKREYIMKKDFLCFTREVLGNLGIEVIGG